LQQAVFVRVLLLEPALGDAKLPSLISTKLGNLLGINTSPLPLHAKLALLVLG
jgi:hypothetical protein